MNNPILNLVLRIVSKVAIITLLIPIVIALLNKKYWNSALKVIFYYIFFHFIIALLLQLIYYMIGAYKDFFVPILNRLHLTNMSFMTILAHLNIFILLGIYFTLVFKNKKVILLVKWVSYFFVISSIINYLFIEGYNVQSVYNSITSATFCFVFSSLHLWYIFSDTDSKIQLLKNPYYWISLGLLIPNIVNTFMYTIGKKLEESDRYMFLLSNIFSDTVQIIGYILIAIGFYYARYTKYLPQKTTTSLPLSK